jgi:hypothetical protein
MKALVIKKAGEAALESRPEPAASPGKLLLLETASNIFIAQLGDPQSSERRLNLSQAFNPLGSITGIVIARSSFYFFGCRTDATGSGRPQGAGVYEAYLRCPGLGVNPRSPCLRSRSGLRCLPECEEKSQ